VDIVAAYDAAAADGVNVINYSYTGPRDFDNPIGFAQRGAAAMGVSVVAAAANSGPDGATVENIGMLLAGKHIYEWFASGSSWTLISVIFEPT